MYKSCIYLSSAVLHILRNNDFSDRAHYFMNEVNQPVNLMLSDVGFASVMKRESMHHRFHLYLIHYWCILILAWVPFLSLQVQTSQSTTQSHHSTNSDQGCCARLGHHRVLLGEQTCQPTILPKIGFLYMESHKICAKEGYRGDNTYHFDSVG